MLSNLCSLLKFFLTLFQGNNRIWLQLRYEIQKSTRKKFADGDSRGGFDGSFGQRCDHR